MNRLSLRPQCNAFFNAKHIVFDCLVNLPKKCKKWLNLTFVALKTRCDKKRFISHGIRFLVFALAASSQAIYARSTKDHGTIVVLSIPEINTVIDCSSDYYFDAAASTLHINGRDLKIKPLRLDIANSNATFAVHGQYGQAQMSTLHVRLLAHQGDNIRRTVLQINAPLFYLKKQIERTKGDGFFQKSTPEGPEPNRKLSTYLGAGKGHPPYSQLSSYKSAGPSWLECSFSR